MNIKFANSTNFEYLNALETEEYYNGAARTGSGTRRIKYFRYYDKNDNLICDIVTCYRKSDGEMGVYDMARSIFLTKAGGGEWTKGADVTA